MADQKLNIAMFGHKHVLSREGGIEIVVKELSTRMAAKGHKVVCYDRSTHHVSGGEIDDRSEYKGVKIIPVWSMSSDNVIFTGFQQGQILEELYSNAYIYCLPSDLEGMPLSLLEAMSYGNCCVVSDIPECTEVVEDKAVVFKKSNIRDLKEKLEKLLENSEYIYKYKREAADFICNKYSWDDVVDRTEVLYK